MFYKFIQSLLRGRINDKSNSSLFTFLQHESERCWGLRNLQRNCFKDCRTLDGSKWRKSPRIQEKVSKIFLNVCGERAFRHSREGSYQVHEGKWSIT